MTDNNNKIIINGKYKIETLIGKGEFGLVYKGININNKNKIVAKFEVKNDYCTIKNECRILNYLYNNKCHNVPHVLWYGIFKNHYTVVLPIFEFTLSYYIFNADIKSYDICRLCMELINILESIHTNFVLHRDIKPEHFMIKNNHLYLIDFGISTFYIDNERHIIDNKHSDHLVGSINYASYYIHEGNTYSRRDDLISIAYVMYFMFKKTLPWDILNNNDYIDNDLDITNINHPRNIAFKDHKNISNCLEKFYKVNNILAEYLSLCYQLSYNETPDYVKYVVMFYD